MGKQRFQLHRLTDYSSASLLEEIRRVCRLVKRGTLTISQFKKHSRVGLTTIRRRFGGWGQALELAGYGNLYNKPVRTKKTSTQYAKHMSDSEVLNEIKSIAQGLNKKSITVAEFNSQSRIHVDTVRRRFGSWRKALLKAGLSPVTHGHRYADDECFDNLLSVWTYYGRPPAYKEMGLPPSKVGGKAYVLRWGTWLNALDAFVKKANSNVEETPKEVVGPRKKNVLPVSDRRNIPLQLRYQVLKRDSFRCVLCGASPAITKGCELHVDHIIPWSGGGKTVIENLRSTCKRCNLGKGARP